MLIIATGILSVLMGCGRDPKELHRDLWAEGGPGAPNLEPGHNFCVSDIDRYPEFGILYYAVDAQKLSRKDETAALSRSIELCRTEFGEAFAEGRLVTIDDFDTHRSEWIDGAKTVRFAPKWIVIILTERGHERAGYVFDAPELFDAAIPSASVAVKGFRDGKPIRYDAKAKHPAHEAVFEIIERFRVEYRAPRADSTRSGAAP